MARRVPLTPLAGSDKKAERFSVCDIEAYQWTKFKVIGWYNGQDYIAYRDMYQFIEALWEEQERVIFAHFGGIYDFLFIIQCVLEKTDYKIESMIPRGSGLLCFDIVKYKGKKKVDKITFKDSSALLPFGLANLTKSFGVAHKKQEFDFDKWDGSITEELLDYLKDDCRGLYECLEKYYDWDIIQRAGPAATMASQSLRVFRLFMYDEIHSLKPEPDEFVRRGYFGGRTEIFRPQYKGKKKLKCYDVNSLYPFVMRNNEFPTNFRCWTRTYDPKRMQFFEATVEVPEDMYLPPLPTVQKVGNSEKLVFPTGTFSGVWSNIELEYAKSLGVKVISTGKGIEFKNGGPLFKGFIDRLYDMRKEAKDRGDGVGDILTKLIMNSNYGRHGLNTHREQVVFDDFQLGFKPMAEIKIKKGNKNYKVRLGTQEVEIENTYTNVAIAAWVTSLARIYMHQIMLPVQEELYYTDTDSLFTTADLESGPELGQLKEEYSCKEAVFLLPKTYVVEDQDNSFKKLAMKGFDKRKIQHFTYDDFFTALEGDLRHMKVTHDAKFAKFKTAARKGNLTTLLPEQDKAIRSQYDKRKILKKGRKWDTKPLHI